MLTSSFLKTISVIFDVVDDLLLPAGGAAGTLSSSFGVFPSFFMYYSGRA